jgi:RES domain.
MWMVGEVEPLKDLLTQTTRGSVIEKILRTYPLTTIAKDQVFYRVRSNLADPDDETQFDSPPANIAGSNRLDSKNFPVMYASTDLHVCIHESRLSADDDVHVATLTPTKDLKVIDLTELLEEDGTEFESLDMAVHMLFLAREHSYEICRDIALAAQSAGLDGLIYPSYFSLLRTGGMPFETGFGISLRQFAHLRDFEKSKIIPNLALFGRPIEDGKVSLRCINRVMVRRVEYDLHFGPTGI